MTDNSQISDGYHTFEELYKHRNLLFIGACRSFPGAAWRACDHDDGTMFDGYFIAGIHLASGDISYHLPVELWDMFDYSGISTLLRAPKWDGHTPDDVIKRLEQNVIIGKQKERYGDIKEPG